MIYGALKDGLLMVLAAPREPPEPPAGSAGSARVFRAAPAFLTFRLITLGLGIGLAVLIEVAVLGGILVSRNAQTPALIITGLVLAITFVALATSYFLIRLDYDMRYYIVTDRAIRIRQGALLIHESTFTLANIQNLAIHQGPIERLLGISNLLIQTAGGTSPAPHAEKSSSLFHRGALRGIANAAEVRDQILALLKQYRDAGLGDPEDRRRAAAPRAAPAGLSPAAVERLGEIRDEVRALRAALAP